MKRADRQALVLGLMSGTSGDGLDLALVQFNRAPVAAPEAGDLVLAETILYPEIIRLELRELLNLGSLDAVRERQSFCAEILAPFWRSAVHDFLYTRPMQPELIVSHGQTLWHAPPFSWQWDDPAGWVREIGIATVTDVRSQDLQAGGQGAPLAPLLHAARFRSADEAVVVLNLGGMANISLLLPSPHTVSESEWGKGIRGWDCGPGNVLIDAAMQSRCGQSCDLDGALASQGTADRERVTHWLAADAWLPIPAPKSTGREYYGAAYADRLLSDLKSYSDADALATITLFSAQAVATSLRQELHGQRVDGQRVGRIVVCGGGAHNLTMLRMVAEETALPVAVDAQADAAEAWLMALIGWRSLHGLPSSLPAVTGARSAAVLGALTPAVA